MAGDATKSMTRLLRNPRVRRILRPHRRRISIALVAMTGRGLVALAVPFFFGSTINLVTEGAPHSAVLWNAGFLLTAAVITAFCQFWMRWLYIGTSRTFEEELRNEVFDHLTVLSFAWFNRSRTGDILSRLTADVEAVRMGVGPGVMHLYQTGTMALFAIVLMLTLSWQLTLIALVPLLIMLVMARLTMPRMHAAATRVQEQLAAISATAQESFSGSRVVKAFARESYEVDRFTRTSRLYIDDAIRMAMVRARMHTCIEILAGIVSISVLYFGGRQVVEGTLSPGMFVSFFGFFMMLIWPMIAIGWTLSLFQRAAVAMDRLEEFLATEPEITGGEIRAENPSGAWSIDGLTFSHPDGPVVLEDITLDLPAGKSLAIVGPTGCGKSTLVQILGRLFDPPAGTVNLDGVDIRRLDLDDLRRSIAFVPQETFLFSDTIRHNIAFADPDTPDDRIRRAADAAQLTAAIDGFVHGMDEIVGERGVTLSGGQKQRCAIARALVHEASTLILDDALSAVDTDTEERLLRAIGNEMKGRSTIIVAHRLSTVMHCDQIVVMRNGRIVERGSHAELLEEDGWYAETWKRQRLTKEIEAA